MSDTYRGYAIPEVHADTPRGFFILDEQFDWIVRGATEEHATNQWRRNIDSHVLKTLVAEGTIVWLYETREGHQVYGCSDCGNYVWEPLAHAETH